MRIAVLKARMRIIDLVNDRTGYRMLEPDKLSGIERNIVNAAADLIVAVAEESTPPPAAPVPDTMRDRVIAEVRSAIVAGRTTPGVTLAVAERCADVLLALLQPAAQQDALLDLAETAWCIIANAGEGRWETQTAEWQAAAARWRDRYHTALRAALAARRRSQGDYDSLDI